MNLYEKNLSALRKKMPDFSFLSNKANDEEFVIEKSKLGLPTCKCMRETKSIYLHSRFNPEKESDDFTSSFTNKFDNANLIILYGLGLGYTAKSLQQKKRPDTELVLIEPSKTIFKLAMENIDLYDLLSDSSVIFVIGEERSNLERYLKLIMKEENFEDLIFVLNPVYKEIFMQESREVTYIIYDIIRLLRINTNTIYMKALGWTEITLLNTKHILESKALFNFKGIFSNKPAIVVGAGPSLSRNIDLLHEVKDKFVVISTYTAYRALEKKGIVPDFIITLDSLQTAAESKEDRKRIFNIPMVYLCIANTGLLDRCNGGKIYCRTHYDDILANIINDNKRMKNPEIAIGGTISVSALDFAVQMGANPVIMIGQDLAFTNSRSHAEGTVYSDKKLDQKQMNIYKKVMVDSIDGGKVETSEQLSVYIKSIEDYIAIFPTVTFIDATEGGALIKGSEIKTLSQTIEQYKCEGGGVTAIVDETMQSADLFSEYDRRQSVKNIRIQMELALEMQRCAKQGLKLSNSLEQMYLRSAPSEKMVKSSVKEFYELDRQMNKILDKTQIFATAYNAIKVKMRSHTRDQEKTEELYLIRHNQIIYSYVLSMCDAVLKGLDRLENSLPSYLKKFINPQDAKKLRYSEKKNKILFIGISSTYDTMNRFLYDLECAFENYGYKVYHSDSESASELSLDEIAFILTFNGVGVSELSVREQLELFGIPVFSFFVDKPEIHYHRIENMTSGAILSFVDQYHVDAFMKNTHIINKSVYLPHGGSEALNANNFTCFEDRVIDILFCGSYLNEDDIRNEFISINHEAQIKTFAYILDKLFENYDNSLDEILDNMVVGNGIQRNTEEYTQNMLIYSGIYEYYRAKYRNDTIRILLEQGLEVTCYGRNWEKTDFIKYKNFKYMGECSFNESLNLMNKSKITLSIMPIFKNGTHERIFNAMLNNSVCLSTKTKAFPEDLIDNETILFYDLNDLSEMFEKIDSVLNNSDKFYKIVGKAKEIATKKHRWTNRAKSILEIYKNL